MSPIRRSFVPFLPLLGVSALCPCSHAVFPGSLGSLNGQNGFLVRGVVQFAQLGRVVAPLGDINGDSIDDVIIGAPFSQAGGVANVGLSYILFGSKDIAAPGHRNADALDGTNGFVCTGYLYPYRSGYAVAYAGDLNHDGYNDVIIGAPDPVAPARSAGWVNVVFGGPSVGASGAVHIAFNDEYEGFRFLGRRVGEACGFALAGIGDFNGDGVDDLLVGAPNSPDGEIVGVGAAYVVFGGTALAESIDQDRVFDATNLNGSNGFVIVGIGRSDNLGYSVAGADFNGDGYSDVAVAAPNATVGDFTFRAGEVYIIFGGPNVAPTGRINVSTLAQPVGMVIHGAVASDELGISMSVAGDLNQDGMKDLVIGAPLARPNGARSGSAYVIFGGPAAMTLDSLDVASLDGEKGFIINGSIGDTPGDAGDLAGFSVAPGGDLNDDGRDDLLVCAPTSNAPEFNSGRVFVLYGAPDIGRMGAINLGSVTVRSGASISGVGINVLSGYSAARAGDVNQDGVGDLIIGVPGYDANDIRDSGQAAVVFGRLPVLGDVDSDGVVGSGDLADLLGHWGTNDPAADLNGDGIVNSSDLAMLLKHWAAR